MAREYTYDTYPPMFTDYEAGIENENYDNEVLMFTVPADWATEFIRKNFHMTVIRFGMEYDWDGTLQIHEAAVLEGVLRKEWIAERDW